MPILGLIHHGNVATVTKQKAFNKSMITPFTEVIFIDEATEHTLDIDDWKILTQGGYAAHDVKYQSARAFINRCPMLITSQRKLEFGPADQPAMERRLRTYTFRSLPRPKKKASNWMRTHPMDCVLWAAQKAKHWFAPNQFDDQLPVGSLAQLVRALHRYRRGQGSNPGKPDFLRLSFRSCISCVNNREDLLYISFFIPNI